MPEGRRIKWRIAVGVGFVLDFISVWAHGVQPSEWMPQITGHWLAAHYGTGVKSSAVNNVETSKHGYSVAHRHWQPFHLFFSLSCLLSFHNQCSSMLVMLCNYSIPVAKGEKKWEGSFLKGTTPNPQRTRSYLSHILPYSPSSLPPLISGKLHCSMQTATSFPRHHRNAESAAL